MINLHTSPARFSNKFSFGTHDFRFPKSKDSMKFHNSNWNNSSGPEISYQLTGLRASKSIYIHIGKKQ